MKCVKHTDLSDPILDPIDQTQIWDLRGGLPDGKITTSCCLLKFFWAVFLAGTPTYAMDAKCIPSQSTDFRWLSLTLMVWYGKNLAILILYCP